MKKRIAYVHIGKHKTGSTSIQYYLYKNHDFFLNNGVRVVTNDIIENGFKLANPTNLSMVAHLILREELMTPVRFCGLLPKYSPAEKEEQLKSLNERFLKYDEEKIILSAEAFSFFRMAGEIEGLNNLLSGFEIVPVFFFRNKEQWLESWKTQLVQIRRTLNPPLTGVLDFGPESWLLDDNKITHLFGKRTKALSYDECLKLDGSVIPAFLGAVGLPPKECPDWGGIWKNDSAPKPKM